MISWHRLFGLAMTELLADTPLEVVLEMDLAVRQQFLDIVIVRRRAGPIGRELPDGFEPLATHNLLTYKSMHESLDAWSIQELIGHYVNYRKQVNKPNEPMPAETEFQLFAVATRFPEKLAGQVPLQPVSAGIYQIDLKVISIRLIVLSEIPLSDQNLVLNAISCREAAMKFARERFEQTHAHVSAVLRAIFARYGFGSSNMPYTMNDFYQDVLDEIAPEDRLRGLSVEQRLRGLSAEQRVLGLSAEDLAGSLPPNVLNELLKKAQSEQTTRSSDN